MENSAEMMLVRAANSVQDLRSKSGNVLHPQDEEGGVEINYWPFLQQLMGSQMLLCLPTPLQCLGLTSLPGWCGCQETFALMKATNMLVLYSSPSCRGRCAGLLLALLPCANCVHNCETSFWVKKEWCRRTSSEYCNNVLSNEFDSNERPSCYKHTV